MNEINYEATGTVFNLQRYSIHDGPGIRTIVFLKGCPLSCKWCSNPESQRSNPELMFNQVVCRKCGRCVRACSIGAISMNNPERIDRSKCTGCGKCVSACFNDALEQKGQKRSVQELISELKKDATYFRRSGGGVTLSGGEPLMQPEFAAELLKGCQARGWNTAIETTLFASEEALQKVLPFVNHALVDMKHSDSIIHQKYTGQSNEIILKNIRLATEITEVTIRVPLIPGFNVNNMDDTVIQEICSFAKSLNKVKEIHLLPYHTYGESKYGLTGREYEMKSVAGIDEETVNYLKDIVEKNGFICQIGG